MLLGCVCVSGSPLPFALPSKSITFPIVFIIVFASCHLQGGAMRARAVDQTSPLGRAYVKFCDALKCDTSGFLYNLHVGRMLLQQGKAKEATGRLRAALATRPTSVEARYMIDHA